MYIVNKKQFLLLPEETIYTEYTPDMWSGLFIKSSSREDDSFEYTDQIVQLDIDDSYGCLEKRLAMVEDSSIKCELHFDRYDIEDCYEEDKYFMIWEKEDVEGLINRLQKTLEGK